MMKTIIKYLLTTLLVVNLVACSEDFFDTDNNGVASGEQIEELSSASPDAVLTVVQPLQVGIYSYMTQWNTANQNNAAHGDFGWMSIGLVGDVMNDDMAFHTSENGWFTFDHQLDYWAAQYVRPYWYWNFFYTLIAKSNEIISKISFDVEQPELKAVLGQALTVRAIAHAYIPQMYQQTYVGNESALGGPIVLTTNEEGAVLGRASLSAMYAQAEKDFKKAIELLEGWERPSKVYIDQSVAAGLYARVCLVTNNWTDAVTYARMAREDYSVFTTTELLADGFNNINSKEWMWGGDITGETTTAYASFFSHVCSFEAGYGGAVGCYKKMDKKLYDAMSLSDVRRQQFKVGTNVTTPGYAFPDYTNIKFKRVDQWLADYVYMRVSEMILTEAEALAQQGNTGEAATVLRELMINRDPSFSATTVTADEVYQQRRIELWGEGFSHFDHLRLRKGIDRGYTGTNHLGTDRYKISAGSWYFLYQLPQRELDNNPDITEQNPAPTGTKFE